MKSIRRALLQVLNFIGFIGMLAVNALANILPINGKNTGQIADSYPNLFVPSGLTFSIWGLIYLLLLGFILYQARDLFSKDPKTEGLHERMGILFFLSCAANVFWILAWHYERVLLSLGVMLILLVLLMAIYLRLEVGRGSAGKSEKILLHAPFSIYFGWISIATIANVTAVLVNYGWNGFGLSPLFWTVVVILVGLKLAILMLIYRADVLYGLVVAWAFAGIVLKQASSGSSAALPIIVTCAVSIGVILAGIGLRFRKWLRV